MWIYILLAVVALVALLVIFILLKSSDFSVSRSQSVSVPASKAFEQVNDLHKMNVWNPWLALDPNVKQTYVGPDSGVGSSYAWDGNSNVGAGRQTIVESKPDEMVRFRLEFVRPFKGVNEVLFQIAPKGNETLVTWSMTGKLNPIAKVMGLFMNMEKMCGDSFEKGLSHMKQIVESKN